MTELTKALTADSAHTPPTHILEHLDESLAHRTIPNAPHTIYQELWHITFWQQVTLDWTSSIETPCPTHNDLSFPTQAQAHAEPWPQLCNRFFSTNQQAAKTSEDHQNLDRPIQCPSPPGHPTRTMTIREQLESLAAHNAYHFGRIVLLRQLLNAWPPPSGGFTW